MENYREKSSRQNYDKAVKKADEAEHIANAFGGINWSSEENKSAYDNLLDKARRTRARVEKLFINNHEDAIADNAKYDFLVEKHKKANEAKLNFEKNGGNEDCDEYQKLRLNFNEAKGELRDFQTELRVHYSDDEINRIDNS